MEQKRYFWCYREISMVSPIYEKIFNKDENLQWEGNIILLFHLREHNDYGHLNVFYCSLQLKTVEMSWGNGCRWTEIKDDFKMSFSFYTKFSPIPKTLYCGGVWCQHCVVFRKQWCCDCHIYIYAWGGKSWLAWFVISQVRARAVDNF